MCRAEAEGPQASGWRQAAWWAHLSLLPGASPPPTARLPQRGPQSGSRAQSRVHSAAISGPHNYLGSASQSAASCRGRKEEKFCACGEDEMRCTSKADIPTPSAHPSPTLAHSKLLRHKPCTSLGHARCAVCVSGLEGPHRQDLLWGCPSLPPLLRKESSGACFSGPGRLWAQSGQDGLLLLLPENPTPGGAPRKPRPGRDTPC